MTRIRRNGIEHLFEGIGSSLDDDTTYCTSRFQPIQDIGQRLLADALWGKCAERKVSVDSCPPPDMRSEDSGDSLAHVAPMFAPDLTAETIDCISLEALWADGVRGIIVDLDNTVVGYRESVLSQVVKDWVTAARNRGFRLVMVSNNFSERVAAVGAQLDLPTVSSALKPLPAGFARALSLLGTAKSQTIVVGDQLLTDVLGAKLFGLRAILTEPLVARDHGTTKILRFIERVVFKRTRNG